LNIFAHIVMALWIPTVLVLFAVLPSRRAVIVSFLAAWLFLPMASYNLRFLPDYTKMSATCAGVFIATLIFDVKRVVRFHPSWADIPMVLFCSFPFISSVVNGLGAYDGGSDVMWHVITWALPYFIGRLYFSDARGLRELAMGIFIGGLIYVPLCLFEVRMSPQLHHLVYGSFPRLVQVRFGGWRPSVFMDGGLQVGMWMAAASLVAIWQRKTGALKRMWGISATWLVLALVVTTVRCGATGALALLTFGIAVMWLTAKMKSRYAVVCFLVIVPAYVALRSTSLWGGEPAVSLANMISVDRAESLKFRFKNEDMLAARALRQPWFGWGSWGRNRVHDEWGKDVSITDGLWIIEFGQHGFAGLLSWMAAMIMPLALLTWRYSARQLTSAEFAPILSLAVLTTLYAIDCLVNAMINPVFMLAGGAVVSFAISQARFPVAVLDREFSGRPDNSYSESVPSRDLYPHTI
jgi:hypothetical protein